MLLKDGLLNACYMGESNSSKQTLSKCFQSDLEVLKGNTHKPVFFNGTLSAKQGIEQKHLAQLLSALSCKS